MIGNDVIDLDKAEEESNWKHPRFLDKICTRSEKIIIEQSSNKFQCIWRLWSMKESAYKIYVQQHRKTFFNPKKLECKLLNNTEGTVYIEDQEYKTVSQITPHYIYTTAFSSLIKNTFSNSFEVFDSNPSEECRLQLLRAFAREYRLDFSSLEIKKDNLGIPQIFYNKVLKENSISISHHGQFAGVSFL